MSSRSLSQRFHLQFLQTGIKLRPSFKNFDSPTIGSSWFRIVVSSKATRLPRSEPRKFPSHGFPTVSDPELIEEQLLPNYKPEQFYPTKLGEVFQNRFQVLGKLGYGSSSTVWLARDLECHQYVTLKIFLHSHGNNCELPFYEQLETVRSGNHRGAGNIRRVLGSFNITGPHGEHHVVILQVAQMSLRDMDTVFMDGQGFDEGFTQGAVIELLEAIDFLHTKVGVVHSDIHSGNLLLGLTDNSLFKSMEEDELENPVARKVQDDRTIYRSCLMKPQPGPLLLSDFGEARLGPGPHAGDIMPLVYRAPEILLQLRWSYAVDIWSVGLTAWDLMHQKTLCTAQNKDGSLSDGVHFAELIAALGPPPPELLRRNPVKAADYWDADGKWIEFVPIPKERTLDSQEDKLEDKTLFLNFIRRALTWDPEQRPTARELLQDPWLQ